MTYLNNLNVLCKDTKWLSPSAFTSGLEPDPPSAAATPPPRDWALPASRSLRSPLSLSLSLFIHAHTPFILSVISRLRASRRRLCVFTFIFFREIKNRVSDPMSLLPNFDYPIIVQFNRNRGFLDREKEREKEDFGLIVNEKGRVKIWAKVIPFQRGKGREKGMEET